MLWTAELFGDDPELCECCGQELPAPRPEDRWWMLLGAIVGGLLIADLFRGPRDA